MTRVLAVAVGTGLTTTTMLMTMMMSTATAQNSLPDEPRQIEWNLGEIYPNVDAWNTAKTALEVRVDSLAAYRGRLGENAATLLEALRFSRAAKLLWRSPDRLETGNRRAQL